MIGRVWRKFCNNLVEYFLTAVILIFIFCMISLVILATVEAFLSAI